MLPTELGTPSFTLARRNGCGPRASGLSLISHILPPAGDNNSGARGNILVRRNQGAPGRTEKGSSIGSWLTYRRRRVKLAGWIHVPMDVTQRSHDMPSDWASDSAPDTCAHLLGIPRCSTVGSPGQQSCQSSLMGSVRPHPLKVTALCNAKHC